MRVNDFEKLSRHEKANAVYELGVYIGKRSRGGLITVLYQIESFYIEISYKKYRCAIHSINSIESTACLDPYLEQVGIEPFVYP